MNVGELVGGLMVIAAGWLAIIVHRLIVGSEYQVSIALQKLTRTDKDYMIIDCSRDNYLPTKCLRLYSSCVHPTSTFQIGFKN